MIPTLNGVPFIPHLPHFDKPKLTYRFKTSIAGGIDGSEDRAVAGQIGYYRKLDYQIQARSTAEQAVLAERLKAALLSRSAAVPYWVRQQDQYSWYPMGVIVRGSWPWAVGENIYIARGEHDGINRDVLINCGGAAVGEWQADCLYAGGEEYAASETLAIDLSAQTMRNCPPLPVLRTCRNYVPGQFIVYTITGLKPGEPCCLRLWFAAIKTGQTGEISISVNGLDDDDTREYSPYDEAGGYNKLDVKESIVYPDHAGTLTITLGHELYSTTCFINAIECRQSVWDVGQVASKTTNASGYTTIILQKRHNLSNINLHHVVCPILFGEPTAQDIEAETPEFETVKLSVSEPLGAAVAKRAAACSPEICGLPAVEPVKPAEPTVVGTTESFFIVNIGSEATPEQFLWNPDEGGIDLTDYAKALLLNEWQAWDERASVTDPDSDAAIEAGGTYSLSNGRWVNLGVDGGGGGRNAVTLMAKYMGCGNTAEYVHGITTVQASREEESDDFSNAYHLRATGTDSWWAYTYDILLTPLPT